MNVRLTIDGRTVEAPAETNIVEAARRLGIEIPTLCYRSGCRPETSCLVCVVRVNGATRLTPACAARVAEGMIVENDTPEVQEARRTALELLLSDHAGDCIAPCVRSCPAGMDIPEMLRLIGAGRLAEAVPVVKRRIPFPATLGRICPAPCEASCRRGELDAPVCIKELQRLVGDYDLAQEHPYLPVLPPATGAHIAIVGAGPAGLTAAYYLRRRGHAVTIFEARDMLGGMMREGPLPEQLPRAIVEAEIATVMATGLSWHGGWRLDGRNTLAELRRRFHAVLLACGPLSPAELASWGLETTERGLAVDTATLQTNLLGVFGAGGIIRPLRLAVRAVSEGFAAAYAMDRYLRGLPPQIPRKPFSTQPGRLTEEERERLRRECAPQPRERLGPESTASQWRAQAARCLSCGCAAADRCQLRRWAEHYGAQPRAYAGRRRLSALQRSNATIYDPGKCIQCGLCVQITAHAQEELGLTFIGRGFDVRVGVPWNETIGAGLQRAAEACVEACPTGALQLVSSKLRRALTSGDDKVRS